MFHLGLNNNVKCPVCGCDSHMVCESRETLIDDNDGMLHVRFDLVCEECESALEQHSIFVLTPYDETDILISFEQHESHFGEGIFA